MKVLVVSGGRSAERDISLVSAEWVRSRLGMAGHSVLDVRISPGGDWTLRGELLEIYPGVCPWRLATPSGGQVDFDILFPVLHGPFGEDGTIQGMCDTAGWRCAGVGVMGSAVAMDKHTMRLLARDAGLPLLPWVFNDGSGNHGAFAETALELGLPLFVKPSRMGSSVGISRVDSVEGLLPALAAAAEHDERILVEKALERPRELEVSVLGSGGGIEASVPGEVVPGRKWYDYQAKYNCSDSRLLIPAPVTPETGGKLRLLAQTAFRLIGGRGYARVDFLMGSNGEDVYFNEMNTIPGFTSISMFPKLWEESGLPPDGLLEAIMQEAMSRPVTGTVRKT